MVKILRKILHLGRASYAVSLPADFIRSTAAEYVMLEVTGNQILIKPVKVSENSDGIMLVPIGKGGLKMRRQAKTSDL